VKEIKIVNNTSLQMMDYFLTSDNENSNGIEMKVFGTTNKNYFLRCFKIKTLQMPINRNNMSSNNKRQ